MSHITNKLFVLIFAALAWPSFTSASSLESEIASANRINAANAMLREGKIVEAIDGYQQVQATAGDRDALDYNLGVAQFRSGDVAAAKAAFTDAAASGDVSLASSSRYNLGNCFYSEALQQAEQDKAAAVQSLRDAISHYRGALRGNPNNADACANIELASELIRKLEEEQQPEEQKQGQQQNQDQQQQDQNSDQQDIDQQQSDQQGQQDSQSQPSEGGDSPKGEEQSPSSEAQGDNEPSESAEDQPENFEEQSGKPEDQSASDSTQEKSSEQSEDQSEQQSSEQPSQSSDEHSGQHSQADQQQPASDDPSPSEESDQSQQIPTGELSPTGDQEQEQGEPRAAVMAAANTDDGLMSKEEALKMLQAVRDRDMLRRLRQQQAERSRHVPVDRDW